MDQQVKLTGHYWGSLDAGSKDAGVFAFGLMDGSGRIMRCYSYGYIASQLARHAQQGQRLVVTGQVTPFGIVVERVLRLLWDEAKPQSAEREDRGSGSASRQP